MSAGTPFFEVDQLPKDYLRPGTARRSVRLGDMLLMFITFEVPTTSPPHQHTWDSILVVDEGELDLTVAGETKRLPPGKGAVIPAGVPHGLTTRTPTARIIETWYPVPETQ